MIADIIVDLQYGDCGKGKVAHQLLKNGDYTHCIRYNGGCNAGHTIYHKGKKFVTITIFCISDDMNPHNPIFLIGQCSHDI